MSSAFHAYMILSRGITTLQVAVMLGVVVVVGIGGVTAFFLSQGPVTQVVTETKIQTQVQTVTAQPPPPQKLGKKVTVGYLTPLPISDGDWGTLGFQAMKQLEEKYGVTLLVSELISPADSGRVIRDMVSKGATLIYADGGPYADSATKLAAEFPETIFVIWKATQRESPNEVVLDFYYHEGAYVTGALAAMMTRTNKIGAISPIAIPAQIASVNAFEAGAKSINPNIEIRRIYVGSLVDPAKGKEAALAMIDGGVDIVQELCCPTGFGVIQAAKERSTPDKPIYVLGFINDKSDLAPNLVLTSVFFDKPKFFIDIFERFIQGKAKSLPPTQVNIVNDGVKLTGFHGLAEKIPENVKIKIEQLFLDIKQGKIKVTRDFQQR